MSQKIKKGIKNPSKAARYLEKMTLAKIGRKVLYLCEQEPTNPFLEDWDNLIILDACRYDAFDEVNTLPGKLEYRFSPASGTAEWLQKTVDEEEFYDTVYVTANPRVNRYEGQFHKVIPAWKTHWDDELNVTPPSDLVNLAKEVIGKNHNKRVVIHFMQPHIPFIGEFGRSEIGIHDGVSKGRDRALDNEYTPNEEPYTMLQQDKLTRDVVEKAYYENLQIVFSALESLFPDLEGKTVVTSDHGEMFGDRGWPIPKRQYGHPLLTAAIGLQKIPWLVYENGSRPDIVQEEPQVDGEIDDEHIQDRLENLGYK